MKTYSIYFKYEDQIAIEKDSDIFDAEKLNMEKEKEQQQLSITVMEFYNIEKMNCSCSSFFY